METPSPKSGWLASLKALFVSLKTLLFGYDFFISYAQEDATRAYGDKLQAMLAARDYVTFRDTTNLLLGENLTLRIRWSLWRTRCLIVLGTERALTSDWVRKEIGMFAGRKRPIVPLDLEQIRTRHSWSQIEEALFEADLLAEPSPLVVDRITASLRGWRANKFARLSLGLVAFAALVVAAIVTWQALNLKERALRLRTQSLVAIAQSLPDSLLRSLVLAEADVNRLPSDAVRTAREIARSSVPETVLQVSTESISAMTVSLDDRWVLTADDTNIVRRWPIQGTADPVTLCTLPWRPERIDALTSVLFCCDDEHAALVNFDAPGEPKVFNKPKVAEEGDVLQLPDYSASHGASAWRAAADGRSVAFCGDPQRIVFFIHANEAAWHEATLSLPDHAALDITLGDQAADGSFAGLVLCTDGSLASFTTDKDRKTALTWLAGRLTPKDQLLDLPDRMVDARAFYAGGTVIVAGMADGSGLVTATKSSHWAPRTFLPDKERKLKTWTVADQAVSALLQWQTGDATHLRLEDFHEATQPLSTRIRVLTQSDYAMGVEGQTSENAPAQTPEMSRPGLSGDGAFAVLPTLRNAWLWSVSAGHSVSTVRAGLFIDEGVRPVFTHDGKRFVIADRSGEMRVWRTDGNALDPHVVGLGSQTIKLASTADGRVLAGTKKGEVFLIEAHESQPPIRLYQHGNDLARCAISPSGTRGAGIFKDGLVALFDLTTRSLTATVQCEKRTSESVSYEDVEFVAEDQIIAFNGVVPSLIDFASHAITARSSDNWDGLHTGSQPSAKVVLVKTEAKALQLVSLPGLEVIRTLNLPPNSETWDIALSPSGKRAAVGLSDGKLLVFDTQAKTDPIAIKVDVPGSSVDCVAIDAADKLLAFGTYAGRAGIVDLRSASVARWFQAPNLEQATGRAENNQAHMGIVINAHFSPDGQRVVTSSGIDGFTRVWQADGECIEAMNTSGVATYAQLLDDGRLLNLTEQGEVSVWRVGVQALLVHLAHRTNASLAPTERIRYLNEDPATAYLRYSESERKRGRSPLPRGFIKIDYR
jgi:WD40 repeat protein